MDVSKRERLRSAVTSVGSALESTSRTSDSAPYVLLPWGRLHAPSPSFLTSSHPSIRQSCRVFTHVVWHSRIFDRTSSGVNPHSGLCRWGLPRRTLCRRQTRRNAPEGRRGPKCPRKVSTYWSLWSMYACTDWLSMISLRRRFSQNQQDVSYTIMALLPTLGTLIIERMDVEGVTQELQSHSKTSKASITFRTPPAPSTELGSSFSMELVPSHEHEIRSENGSSGVSSGVDDINTSDLGSSVSAMSFSQVSTPNLGVAGPSSLPTPSPSTEPPEKDLSASFITTTTTSSASSAAQGETGHVSALCGGKAPCSN